MRKGNSIESNTFCEAQLSAQNSCIEVIPIICAYSSADIHKVHRHRAHITATSDREFRIWKWVLWLASEITWSVLALPYLLGGFDGQVAMQSQWLAFCSV